MKSSMQRMVVVSPAPLGPRKAKIFPPAHLQVHPAQRPHPTVGFHQIADLDGEGFAHLSRSFAESSILCCRDHPARASSQSQAIVLRPAPTPRACGQQTGRRAASPGASAAG
jgi:hypothetical protein